MSTKNIARHPGIALREKMAIFNLGTRELARKTGMSASYISDITNEKRLIGPKISIELGRVFGHSLAYYYNLSCKYRFENAYNEYKEVSVK